MPLAFDSRSHGRIAFGFFNIDSDMLLLERRFFFADAFCRAVGDLARSPADVSFEAAWPGFAIETSGDVGDLMGAIHGVRFTGFIGETYRRYPFPEREEDFRQKPEATETREEFREMVSRYGEATEIRLAATAGEDGVTLAGCRFAPEVFLELVDYVRRGGYPRWRDEERPGYVLAMGKAIDQGGHPLFRGPGEK